MHKSTTAGGTGANAVLDRLFTSACTAVFLLLAGGVAQAVYLSWG